MNFKQIGTGIFFGLALAGAGSTANDLNGFDPLQAIDNLQAPYVGPELLRDLPYLLWDLVEENLADQNFENENFFWTPERN